MNGKEPGDEIAFPLGSHMMSVRATMHSIVPVEHLELVQNGKVVATVPLSADHKCAAATVKVPVERSGWITLRAWSEHATPPMLDMYPFATTSPVYLTIAGIPPRSPDDARYFIRLGRSPARRRGAAHGLEQRRGEDRGARSHLPCARGVREALVRDRRVALAVREAAAAGDVALAHAAAGAARGDVRRVARRVTIERAQLGQRRQHSRTCMTTAPAR